MYLKVLAVWHRLADSWWVMVEVARVVVRAVVEAVARCLRSTVSSTADFWWQVAVHIVLEVIDRGRLVGYVGRTQHIITASHRQSKRFRRTFSAEPETQTQ